MFVPIPGPTNTHTATQSLTDIQLFHWERERARRERDRLTDTVSFSFWEAGQEPGQLAISHKLFVFVWVLFMCTQWILLSVTCKYVPLRFVCVCLHPCVYGKRLWMNSLFFLSHIPQRWQVLTGSIGCLSEWKGVCFSVCVVSGLYYVLCLR